MNNTAYRGKILLVTGGAGAIGSNLVRALLGLEPRAVVVLDDLSSGRRWNLPDSPLLRFIEGSVTDGAALDEAFRDGPDAVFHLAALFANQNSVDHPERDLEVNGMGTLRVLRASVAAGVGRFVLASSGCSYHQDGLPLPVREEDAAIHPSTPYQITKGLGELYCEYFHKKYGLPAVRARLFNSFGPGEVPGPYRNVIPNFLYLALSGRPLVITGTGRETRDFTWVGDIVDGLLRAGAAPEAVGEALNLASGREIEIAHVAEVVLEVTGSTAGVCHAPRRDWDTKTRLVADISKARRLLGYAPGAVTFEEGVRRTLEWMRRNWDRIRGEVEGSGSAEVGGAGNPGAGGSGWHKPIEG